MQYIHFITAAALAAAVIIFGIELQQEASDDSVDEAFGWGFFVAIGTSVTVMISGCVLLGALCAQKNKSCNVEK